MWSCIAISCVAGCGTKQTPLPKADSKIAAVAQVIDRTPGVVEITSVKAQRRSDNIIYFEVAYKFTAGSPVKNYMLNLAFPGSTVSGQKPMDAWEVKSEGTIKTGLPVSDPEAKTYEVTFAEADSPDQGYKVISNKATGEVEPSEDSKL